ncbi:hypothetical protein B0J13DRAFT_309329 [Dactylonectria estremocensis]|uniref:Uncharacterized protein n=1 Tax=Dactylonectria estremocensis TaxID=1079267 RepID=A0A9P9F0N1_9HYPO|nr:hypothetical protein B0J13DRAFT_309329 [Dactylonectria estremocensis]
MRSLTQPDAAGGEIAPQEPPCSFWRVQWALLALEVPVRLTSPSPPCRRRTCHTLGPRLGAEKQRGRSHCDSDKMDFNDDEDNDNGEGGPAGVSDTNSLLSHLQPEFQSIYHSNLQYSTGPGTSRWELFRYSPAYNPAQHQEAGRRGARGERVDGRPRGHLPIADGMPPSFFAGHQACMLKPCTTKVQYSNSGEARPGEAERSTLVVLQAGAGSSSSH